MKIKQDIQVILGSRNRLKILSFLSKHGPVNISKIADKLGVSYTATLRHLEVLKENGLVKETQYGKIRIFQNTFSSLELSIIDEIGLVFEIKELEEIKNPSETKTTIYEVFKKNKLGPKLRNKIKALDKNKCAICGLSELDHINKHDLSLTIHHIDENKTNNKENNLITLCMSCHVKAHKSSDDETRQAILNYISKRK